MSNDTFKFEDLKDSICRKECILVLGPNIEKLQNGNITKTQTLAQYLANLPDLNMNINEEYANSLEFVVNKYLALNNPNNAPIWTAIRNFLTDETYACNYELYDEIAALSFFDTVINTSFCDNISAIFENQGYEISFYPNALAPQNHKKNLYNLFGNLETYNDETNVFSFQKVLAFLKAFLVNGGQQRARAFPNFLAERIKEKTFLFIGFDFNKFLIHRLLYIFKMQQSNRHGYILEFRDNNGDGNQPYPFPEIENLHRVSLDTIDGLSYFLKEIKSYKSVQTSTKTKNKKEIFIVSHSEDEKIREKLEKQLNPLVRSQTIDLISNNILASDIPINIFKKKIEQADIIIFLISDDFIASNLFQVGNLYDIVESIYNKGKTIIPIKCRNVLIEDAFFEKIQALPVEGWIIEANEQEVNGIFEQIVKKIKEAIE